MRKFLLNAIELYFKVYLIRHLESNFDKRFLKVCVNKMYFFLDNLNFLFKFAILLHIIANFLINVSLNWIGLHLRLIQFPKRLYFGIRVILRSIIFDEGMKK
jgi:hypothetical protein